MPDISQTLSPYLLTTEYIRHHAAKRPKSVAVIDQGKVFTFADFHRDIHIMMDVLDDLGLKQDQIVAVEFLPGVIEFPSFYYHWVKLLALEALGLATMTFTRAETIPEKNIFASLDRVLAFPDAPGLPTDNLHVMDKEWIGQAKSRTPDYTRKCVRRPLSSASRIIKSSGTTGSMKYMIRSIENQEFINTNTQIRGEYNHKSRYFVSGGFAVSAFQAAAVSCIRAGGSCIYDTRHNTAQTLTSYEITHASFLIHKLIEILESLPDDFQKPASLHILTLGAPVSDSVRQKVLTSLASNISETYGTNESSTISTIGASGEGVLLLGVEVEIVDDNDAPLTGSSGWIRVRSSGCVKGYLNDPDATQKMFRNGWFYPGDIGIMEDPYTLKLLGRSDSLLNIRGIKYAPEDAEEKLCATLPILDACILTVPDKDDVEHLMVAIVIKPGEDQKAVTRRIAKVLPAYFGKTQIAYVPKIPRTSTGKIERQTLRKAMINSSREV